MNTKLRADDKYIYSNIFQQIFPLNKPGSILMKYVVEVIIGPGVPHIPALPH